MLGPISFGLPSSLNTVTHVSSLQYGYMMCKFGDLRSILISVYEGSQTRSDQDLQALKPALGLVLEDIHQASRGGAISIDVTISNNHR